MSEASKSLERIRAKAKDKHWPVPSGAVGMFGPAGQNMDASIKLKEYRALNPDLVITAEMVNMTGAPGRTMDASNMLHALRTESPGQAVSAEDVGMPGAPGRTMDAALHNADLPLMLKDPSQYPGIQRTLLKEQQAKHKNLIDLGVHFYVDGKVCTPCEAHLELELELKLKHTHNPSSSASFSLQKAYERMGEKGNLRFVKVCSTHATSTSPGVEGFDIYAYYPPPALSSAQSASSSIDSNVVQEPVRPSAFSLLKPSTGAPLKRTVGHVRNENAKCPWPGCTRPPFPRTADMKIHFNSHTVGSTEVKRRGGRKKILKK